MLKLAASDWTRVCGGGWDAAREPDRNRKHTALVQRGLGAPKLGSRGRALSRLGNVTRQAFIRWRLACHAYNVLAAPTRGHFSLGAAWHYKELNPFERYIEYIYSFQMYK